MKDKNVQMFLFFYLKMKLYKITISLSSLNCNKSIPVLRLRSLGLDRKRSESLPPALTRGAVDTQLASRHANYWIERNLYEYTNTFYGDKLAFEAKEMTQMKRKEY